MRNQRRIVERCLQSVCGFAFDLGIFIGDPIENIRAFDADA
jgi:hypothetical protein